MGGGPFLVKLFLFLANIFFALAGLALLGIGIAAELRLSAVTDAIDMYIQAAPIATMVVGWIVFTIAFFGCCGAIREDNCMLVTYSIFMLMLMILKVTLAVFIFLNLDVVTENIPLWFNNAFNKDRTGFQEIERAFHCCGPLGGPSYGALLLPDSCCTTSPCVHVNAYESCSTTVINFLNTFGLAISIVTIVVASFEFVAVLFGLCLANQIRNRDRRSPDSNLLKSSSNVNYRTDYKPLYSESY